LALPPALETELRTLPRSFRAANGPPSVPGGAGKALEAWLLMKLAEASTEMPDWSATLRQGDGSPLPSGATFLLPNQPSSIPASNPAEPGFVLLEHRRDMNLRFELQGSLQWGGRSGARHECDISLIPAAIAEAIRNSGGGYPRGLPIAAIECKDKIAAGTLDETRQTLARLFDLALVTRPPQGWSCRIFESNTSTRWGRSSSKYMSLFARGTFGIARVGAFQGGARTLADHYSISRYNAIYDPAGLSIRGLQSSFQTTLRMIGNF
jgi:hypothetical protein